MFTFIEVSRRRNHENSPSRTFIRPYNHVLYKKPVKADELINEVQSVVCVLRLKRVTAV